MKITEQDKEKARALLKKLTLKEKLTMIHGAGIFETGAVERLSIPPLKFSDGPMGVRREFERTSWKEAGHQDDFVTYLPSNSAIAATWNRRLAYESGRVLGEEARGRGKDVILAPGINIKRSPLCGRNFEYMSEDPYLTAEQCVPLIQGIQESDVAACVKHFAVNNQERNRLWVNVEVEERILREIYLPAFQAAVQKGEVLSVMGAYNLLRKSRCCENEYLLDTILRKEWGFAGVTVSDWGGILRTKESAEVSMDVEMSIYTNFEEYCFAAPLREAVQNKEIPEETIEEKVFHILCVMSALHMLDGERKSGCYNTPAHRATTLETARESVVLLKNENHRLPLSEKNLKELLVVGQNAQMLHSGGGGSAEVKALYEISPLLGLKSQLGGTVSVRYVPGYYIPEQKEKLEQTSDWQENSLENREGTVAEEEVVTPKIARKRKKFLEESVELAKQYKDVIFIGGLNHQYDLEDQDRRDMKLPYGQDDLIEALLEANPDTVIVLNAGSPVEMYRWKEQAKAIVWHWYAGMEGGTALAEILFGKCNPSGRLPESFPVTHMDCSSHCIGEFGKKDEVQYKEGIFVGYRYYDTKKIPVSFPFGHGLSYTEFSFERGEAMCEEDALGTRFTISCFIKNIGSRAGKEVVQLYVSPPGNKVLRPHKELKGYEKVELQPGEEKLAVFHVRPEELAYYDEVQQKMCVEPGTYEFLLGASVEDIRCRMRLMVKG